MAVVEEEDESCYRGAWAGIPRMFRWVGSGRVGGMGLFYRIRHSSRSIFVFHSLL